jgi:uncharacterized protein YjaZ
LKAIKFSGYGLDKSLIIVYMLLMITIYSCTKPQENILDQDDIILVDSIGTNRITFNRNATVVDTLKPLIINKIKLAVDSVSRLIEMEDVEFRVTVFPEPTMPHSGMSGVAPDKQHLYILLNPGNPNLSRGIREELIPTVAHEFHHTMRHRTEGYGKTLYEALISEGLAEHFTFEVIGKVPPWAAGAGEIDFEYWLSQAKRFWLDSTYNYSVWFTGRDSIPPGTGHRLGAWIVEKYLKANPQERASKLYDADAEIFVQYNEE